MAAYRCKASEGAAAAAEEGEEEMGGREGEVAGCSGCRRVAVEALEEEAAAAVRPPPEEPEAAAGAGTGAGTGAGLTKVAGAPSRQGAAMPSTRPS